MAENSISILASEDNHLIHTVNGKPTVSSRDVALHFQKKHKNVLQDIERIRSMVSRDFYGLNFQPTFQTIAGPNNSTRKEPMFLLTRDAFSLLAMGFTGKAVITWKIKYIEAFNALETAALDALRGQLAAARQEGILTGRAEALTTRRRDTPAYRTLLRRAIRYRGMGLELREIGKLMDCSHQKIFYMLKDAAILGMGGAAPEGV